MLLLLYPAISQGAGYKDMCPIAAKLYHAACSERHTQYTHYKDNVLSVAEELETKTCLTTCSFFCKIVNYTGFMVFTCGNIFQLTIVVFVCALLNGALVHSPPLSQLIISHVKWRRCDKIQQAWVAGENWQKENAYLRVQYWNNMVTFCGPAFFYCCSSETKNIPMVNILCEDQFEMK